ncbi:MAG: DOPA 4,5-dioxygenase family protein [Bacteriovoracaceae bacterium]|nr:DOPA 4,5-dioxygenase family protein [Bacteriovoracaceae bacterium]
MNDSSVINYHAHIYFNPEDMTDVHKLITKISDKFPFEIGRVWDKPIGPHPVGSCQITVTKEKFGSFIPWLMQEREGFDFFVHANTGNDLLDHTHHVMWLGKSYPLNLDLFKKS